MSKKSKRQLNKYIRFTSIGFQLGATIYLAVYLGEWLDNYFSMSKKLFTLGLILFGLIASIWSIVKQLEKINNEQ